MKYLVIGTLQYSGQIEIEADSALEAVELFNETTPDDLDRDGLLFSSDSDIRWMYVLQGDKWVITDENY